MEDILDKAIPFCLSLGMNENDAHSFTEDIQASALLREIGTNRYAFSHLTLQEYLAAKELAASQDREMVLCRSYFDPALVEMEVLPMAMGLMKQPNKAFEVLRKLPESLTYNNLRLSIKSLTYIKPSKEQWLITQVERLSNHLIELIKQANPYLSVVVEKFATIHNKYKEQVINKVVNLLQDQDSSVRGSAAKALAAINNKTIFNGLKNSLTSQDYPLQDQAQQVIGYYLISEYLKENQLELSQTNFIDEIETTIADFLKQLSRKD